VPDSDKERLMATVRMLLAGPGTGKTRKIKELIKAYPDAKKVLVLSFTNATITDLHTSFKEAGIAIDGSNCMTLHKYAMILNHLDGYQVLNENESRILTRYAQRMGMKFTDLCTALKCITYDEMIAGCASYVSNNPAYAKEKIGDIDLLIVDEYQDFNQNERDLIDLIIKHTADVVILGDDDQSIYGFKDADPAAIIALHRDTSIDKIPHEHKCYRCPDAVVEAASNLIQHNSASRVAKDWHPSGKPGDLIIEQFMTQRETAEYVVTEIEKIYASFVATEEMPKPQIMVLVPVKVALGELATLLDEIGLPMYFSWLVNN
jgi:superfamily I DNA/RNA helicase